MLPQLMQTIEHPITKTCEEKERKILTFESTAVRDESAGGIPMS